jgi:type IV pilus assembly protein PilV
MLTRGFTVIEVLVTLVILMFGLMGIAGLMAKGQRAAFEAFQRQTALTYAVSIAERIRSNRLQAPAYAGAAPLATPSGRGTQYQDYLDHNVTDCGSTNCSQAALATYDISMWDGLLSGFTEQQAAAAAGTGNVGGIIRARGCIVELSNTSAACPAPPAPTVPFTRTIQVSVAWQGDMATSVPTASTCGQGLYGAGDDQRRVIALNLMVSQPCP